MDIPHTIQHFADFLGKFIDYLGEPVPDVWGHSFGGSIALIYAAHHSAVLRRLIIVSPAISTTGLLTLLGRLYYQITILLPKRMQKSLVSSPIMDHISGELLIKHVSKACKRQLEEAGRRNLKDTNPAIIIESSLSYFKVDFSKTAHKVTVPTLVIAGKLDQLVPIDRIEKLSE
jgi:pimeloyl-ACP methyl ester carboxylesterase